MSKNRQKDGQTARRALECLASVTLEKGLDGVSMRNVAKELGISLAALQYHYPTKAALIDAFIASVLDDYRASLREVLELEGDGSRVEAAVRHSLERGPEDLEHYAILIMIEARAVHDESTARSIEDAMRTYVAIFQELVLADEPRLSTSRALVAATLIASTLEGAHATIDAAVALGAERDEIVDSIVRMLRITLATMI